MRSTRRSITAGFLEFGRRNTLAPTDFGKSTGPVKALTDRGVTLISTIDGLTHRLLLAA
jgi:hypothetical protein